MFTQKNFMTAYTNTGYYLKVLSDQLIAHLHERLEQAGYGEIKPSHGWIFQYIGAEGSRITELAAKANVTKQSMSALIYQLEEWGYLERKEDESDKRAVLFVLTDKGQELRKVGRAINFEFEKNWQRKLGSKQYEQLRELLAQLL
jgi:DNA-binding MarR family transcriptional regulator